MLVLENVPNHDLAEKLLGTAYDITVLANTSPSQVGYHAVSRLRSFKVCIHRRWASKVGDTLALYKKITDVLSQKFVPMSEMWIEMPVQVELKEMFDSMNVGCQAASSCFEPEDVKPYLGNWLPLCGKWEQTNFEQYKQAYQKKFDKNYRLDPDAVVVLNQSAKESLDLI